MAYTPTVWECGDTITADKLNHMEAGIEECCGGGGSEPLMVTMAEREATIEECPYGGSAIDFSHSWQEMYDAFVSGKQVLIVNSEALRALIACSNLGSGYYSISTSDAVNPIVTILFQSPTAKTAIHCVDA